MPIRPAHLATMSATIADAVRPSIDGAVRRSSLGGASAVPSVSGPVTIVFESGHRQMVDGAGTTELVRGHGGIVKLEARARTDYAVYADAACTRVKRLRSGSGPARFIAPIHAAAIVLG